MPFVPPEVFKFDDSWVRLSNHASESEAFDRRLTEPGVRGQAGGWVGSLAQAALTLIQDKM